jgi:TP901 family phage tail tape measure protein
MANFNYNIRLRAFDDLSPILSRISLKIKTLQKTVKDASADINTSFKKINVAPLNKQITGLSTRFKNTSSNINKMTLANKKATDQSDRLLASVLGTDKALKRASISAGRYGAAIKQAGDKTKKFKKPKAFDDIASSQDIASKSSGRFKAMLGKINLQKFNTGLQKTNNRLKAMSGNLMGTAASMAAFALTLAKPIRDAMAFEESFADVNKVVDGTKAQMKALKGIVLDLSKKIPLLPAALNKIVAAGGRLGIPREKLAAFTTTVAKASVAFEMSAETAGTAFASISNKMRIPLSRIGELGDAINHLSDTTAATAPAIINIMGRLSGTMKQLKIPPELAAGMAAFGDQVFATQELASSGINQFVSALARTNKKFGLFTRLQKEGAAGFGDILKSMQKLDITQLTDMFGMEAARAIGTMSGSMDVYAKTMKQVSDKTKFAGSMQKEFASRSATTANKLKLMQNSVNRLMITVGDVFLPVLTKVINKLTPLIDQAKEWAEANQHLIKRLMGVVAIIATVMAGVLAFKLALIPVTVALSALSATISIVKGTMIAFNAVMIAVKASTFLFAGALTFVKVALMAASIAFKAFAMALAASPIIAIVMGLVLAAGLIYQYWGPISEFFTNLWVSITSGALTAYENIINLLSMSPMEIITTAWSGIKEFFTGLWTSITEGITNAMKVVTDKIATVTGVVSKVKSFFGFGADAVEAEMTQKQINENITAPIGMTSKNMSEVTVQLEAKNLNVTGTQTKTRGEGLSLNLGVNSLGAGS